MTLLWRVGEPIRVVVDDQGIPLRWSWRQHTHSVELVTNQWRVDVGWWRLRIWRDYYKLCTTDGWLVAIYHDRLRDSWFMQRVYD